MENMLLDVEFHDGDISEECWSADELWPEEGRVANPRMEGPGMRRPRGSTWRIGQAQVMLAQGVNMQLRLADCAGRLHLMDRPLHCARGRGH